MPPPPPPPPPARCCSGVRATQSPERRPRCCLRKCLGSVSEVSPLSVSGEEAPLLPTGTCLGRVARACQRTACRRASLLPVARRRGGAIALEPHLGRLGACFVKGRVGEDWCLAAPSAARRAWREAEGDGGAARADEGGQGGGGDGVAARLLEEVRVGGIGEILWWHRGSPRRRSLSELSRKLSRKLSRMCLGSDRLASASERNSSRMPAACVSTTAERPATACRRNSTAASWSMGTSCGICSSAPTSCPMPTLTCGEESRLAACESFPCLMSSARTLQLRPVAAAPCGS